MNWSINDRRFTHNYISSLNRQLTYINTEVQSPIYEITLCCYQGGNYIIEAKYQNPDNLALLAEALVKVGLPRPVEFTIPEKVLKLDTSDKQSIGVFLRAIIGVQPSIRELITSISDALGVQFDNTYTPPAWLVRGNFSYPFNSRYSLNRKVTYVSTEEQSSIFSEISLLGYRNGNFIIAAKYQNPDNFVLLADALVKVGLPRPDESTVLAKVLKLDTSDKQSIGVFLRALINIQPNIRELSTPVSDALWVQFDNTYIPPAWMVKGNFSVFNSSFALRSRFTLNREVTYVITEVQSRISEISLRGYWSGNFIIEATYKNPADFKSSEMVLASKNLMHLVDSNHDKNSLLLRLMVGEPDKRLILVFLQAITQIQQNIEQVIAFVSDALNIQIEQSEPSEIDEHEETEIVTVQNLDKKSPGSPRKRLS